MRKLILILTLVPWFCFSQSPEKSISLESAFDKKSTYKALDGLILSDAKKTDVERKFHGYNIYMYAPVFEGAVGFGANWMWSNTYEVYVVTNLNDSGPGSFREGVESIITADGRIIVFNGLSGAIIPNSQITFNQTKQLYIAGQTSENGILVRGDSGYFSGALFRISNANGFIIRGMTFAIGGHGSTCCGDNFNIGGGTNIVIDRVTAVWSVDESVGGVNATNVTWQNSLLAESLSNSFHTEGEHSKAMLISNNSDKWSYYRNAFALNVDRNPLWGGDSPGPPLDEIEYVQNVIYGWDNFGFVGENTNPLSPSVINNVAISLPYTSSTRYAFAFNAESTGTNVYGRDNYDDNHRTNPADPDIQAIGCTRCGLYMSDEIPSARFSNTTPHGYPLDSEPELTRAQVIDTVSTYAGDFNDTGSITSRIRAYIAAETGGAIIDDESDVGGYPSITAGTIITDTDSDGIPDSEEATWGNDTFGYVNSLISGASPTSNPSSSKSIKSSTLRINGGNTVIKSN